MKIEGGVALVTGAAQGIGRALAHALVEKGATVVVSDLDQEGAERVAEEIGACARGVDVSRQSEIRAAVDAVEEEFGRLDLMVSNAGIAFSDAPGWTAASQTDEQWEKIWRVNVMAHIWAVRAALPGMIRRGGGHFLHTVSAAGLLNQIGDAAYSTTKHAALGFAESVAITHGEQGIGVTALCPQAVQTTFYEGAGPQADALAEAASQDGVLSPEEVAHAALRGVEEGEFLVTPHPQARDYFQRKASDYDRWLNGMRRLRRKVIPSDDGMDLGSSAE